MVAEFENMAIPKLHRSRRDAATLRSCSLRTRVLDQLGGTRDVVGMGMGFHAPPECEPVFPEHLEVALDLLIHRVDDECFATALVEKHIGICAGGGVKKLKGVHDESLGK